MKREENTCISELFPLEVYQLLLIFNDGDDKVCYKCMYNVNKNLIVTNVVNPGVEGSVCV